MNKAVQNPVKVLELKGATLAVLTILARSADVSVLTKALDGITGGAPDFFEYDAAVIDFSLAENLSEAPPDWQDVRWIFTRHRLNLFAVRAAPVDWMAKTLAAGLTWIAEGEVMKDAEKGAKKNNDKQPLKQKAKSASPQGDEQPQQVAVPTDSEAKMVVPAKRAERSQKEQTSPTTARASVSAKTMVLDKPLRSGQRVYAPADLIVTAAVHPGSEVIADGNIHVYAPLRGRALAGARGDESARILSTCFEAELVSIAGVYLTFEPGTPADVFGKAAQVKLETSDADAKTKLRVLPLAG